MRIRNASFVMVIVTGLVSSGCGGKAFTKGEYDDPSRVELLDDDYNESDMQQMADQVVGSMLECPYVKGAEQAPVLIMEKVQNRTEEHIDTKMLTDKIRTAMIKSHKVRFVEKEARDTLEEEYQHSESGAVSKESAKKRGKQVGADYILGGRLSTNIQEVGNDKLIYYKLTMNLTNLDTSVIDCVEEKEIRKKYRKRTVGL